MKRLKLLLPLLIVSVIHMAAYGGPADPKGGADGLPPGLQKKAARGEPLPPGWQKKLAKGDVLDEGIYIRGEVVVPLGDDGSITVVIDGTRLRLHAKTRTILDILD